MADINATDLTEEILSTLSGDEQFVMFDTIEGKRAALSVIANYIAEHGEINGDDIPTIVSTIEGNIGTLDTKVGDLTDLDTTDKTSIVSAINEVNGKAEDADEKADTADEHVGDLSELDTEDKTSAVNAINEAVGEITNLKEDLQDKADQNGVYPDLSAGNITGDFHIDTKPYLYRALRDVASHIGSKAFDTLVGGTVAMNQKVQNGNFESNSKWDAINGTKSIANNVCTVTATENGLVQLYQYMSSPQIDHCYLASCEFNPSVGDKNFYARIGDTSLSPRKKCDANKWTQVSGIKRLRAVDITGTRMEINAYCANAILSGESYQVRNFVVFDLTQMFGSTIADYAYTLESTTEGSGIAWLKSYGFLTKDYYPYNEGALQSVLTTGKKCIGFNQWDEEWEQGRFDSDGSKAASINQIRSKNFFPVLPSTTYYFCVPGSANGYRIVWYDINQQQIRCDGVAVRLNTTPANCYYAKFSTPSSYGITYLNDICINLSKTTGSPKNGDYRPYESVTYQISPEELRGTLKLVNNEIQYNGDEQYPDGTKKRNYGDTDLASYNWSYASGRWRTSFTDAKWVNNATVCSLVSDKYIADNANRVYANAQIDTIAIEDGTYISVYNGSGDTAPTGHLTYEKATPTTETADPFTSPQQVFADGTEEYLDTRTVPIPVGHETKYELDLAEKLIGLPWDMSMIAPVEVEYKATRNYTAGQYLIVDNTLYKVTSNISNGGTITPNSNVTETTVATELIALA